MIDDDDTDWEFYARTLAPMSPEDVKEFRAWVAMVISNLTPDQRARVGLRRAPR